MKKPISSKGREVKFPRVIVSVTMTLDGRISTRSRRGKTLPMKGVMLGFTGRKKSPKSPKLPVPIRVIVNEGGGFNPKSMGGLFDDSGSLLLLCTAKEVPDRVLAQLPPFIRVVEFPGGKIPMEALLAMLRSVWEVKLLLCEGEPSLLKPLLAVDAVEELHLTMTPLIQGGSDTMSLTGHPDGFLRQGRDRRFRLKSLKEDQESGEAILHYLRDRSATK